tara:strand:- start:183 stop:347 length:165 start_codon:yes stop_codon:yes gene_type:complete
LRYLFLLLFLIGCGDLPKEGDGSEKIDVKIEIKYDNNTTQRYLARKEFILFENI